MDPTLVVALINLAFVLGLLLNSASQRPGPTTVPCRRGSATKLKEV